MTDGIVKENATDRANTDAADRANIDTVLFDLDGTLMDSNGLISASWRYTVGTLTGRSISDDDIRSTLGEILVDSMVRIMPEIDPEVSLETYRVWQRERFLDQIILYDGAEDLLRTLKENGYKTALVTSRMRGSTERALAHFGIDGFFDEVLTADDTTIFKPDPAPIFLILDRLGSKPENAIFIGDTNHDIEAGLAAGVFTVLVDWSFALPPEKRAAFEKPDAVIDKLPDILEILGLPSAHA